MSECRVCREKTDETFFLDLPVNGSEGIRLCLHCRVAVTNFVSHLQNRCSAVYHRLRMAVRKKVKGL